MKYTVKIIGIALSIASSLYAIDVDISGFGTIGGAISDKSYTYQRFINEEGTLNKDSVFGLQGTIVFNPQWSATVQGKFAPALDDDTQWDPQLAWAFISYRPSNDWLIRMGKIRMPLYLNSQNMDIGVTYDMARLPHEIYSLSPSNDGLGGIITKTFELDSGEMLIDAFYGQIDTPYRTYMRDDLSAFGGFSKGANFEDLEIALKGLSISYEVNNGDRYRAGVYQSKITKDGVGTAGNFLLQPSTTFPLSVLYPFPYYQPDGSLNKSDLIAFTVGADIGLGKGYRLSGEYAMRKMLNSDTGPNAQGAYLMLSKNIDKWTPYVRIATLKTNDNVKDLYATLNTDPVNQALPVNRHYADLIVGAEQNSVAIGFSYVLSPMQKIKAEWSHARIGAMSNFLVDNNGPEAVSHENINVFSLSYSMSF